MGDVGNVYAHFPVAVGHGADGKGIVEILGILGVDGECGGVAEVLAASYFLGGDSCIDFVGGFLHVLRVFIGKTVLGENGVYLGVVFAGASEDVDHSAFGVLGFFRPFGYAHDCLVAAFAPF